VPTGSSLPARAADVWKGWQGTLLILLLSVFAGAVAGKIWHRSASLQELAKPVLQEPVRFTIWFVFRPSDCGLSSNLLQELNDLNSVPFVAVRGVMLDPPLDESEATRVAAALGIEFPVVLDFTGEWRQATVQARQPDPLMLVLQGTTRLGVISPALMRSLRTLTPSAMLLGRDP